MKNKIVFIFALFLTSFSLVSKIKAAEIESATQKTFHPPQTEAERALDGMLIIESGLVMYDYEKCIGCSTNFFGYQNRYKLDYWLTKNEIDIFLNDVNEATNIKNTKIFDKNIVDKISTNSTKQYYNYILCADDYFDEILYQTNEVNNKYHTIITNQQNKYALINKNNKWILFDVECF